MDQTQGSRSADVTLARLLDNVREIDLTVAQLKTKQEMHDQHLSSLATKAENTSINAIQVGEGIRRLEESIVGLRQYNEQVRDQLQSAFGSNSNIQNFGDRVATVTTDLRSMLTRLDECERKVAEHLTSSYHMESRYREQIEVLRDEIMTLDNKQSDLTDAVDELKDSVTEFRTTASTIMRIMGSVVAFITLLTALQSVGFFDFWKR